MSLASAFVAVALTILSATCSVHAAVQFEPALDPLAYPSGLTATRKVRTAKYLRIQAHFDRAMTLSAARLIQADMTCSTHTQHGLTFLSALLLADACWVRIIRHLQPACHLWFHGQRRWHLWPASHEQQQRHSCLQFIQSAAPAHGERELAGANLCLSLSLLCLV